MIKAIGLCGSGPQNENQAIVAAQLLDRFTQRGLAISVWIGVHEDAEAGLIHMGGGELWRVGVEDPRLAIESSVDRWIETRCDFNTLIAKVDDLIEQFLSKRQVAA
jgi:hypothetical protein